MPPIKVVLLACGSFNPPTNMHLRMFEIAKDYLHRTGNYVVVGGLISPVHDSYGKKDLASAKHRLQMLELALENNEWINISDWEATQEGWSRTKLTLQHHQNLINSAMNNMNHNECDIKMLKWLPNNAKNGIIGPVQVKLLCGGDLLESFGTPGLWADEDIDTIVGDHGLVVITRGGTNPHKFIYESDMLTRYMNNIHIVPEWITNEVSSTKIRRALRRSDSVKYLIPDNVINYIVENGLYGTKENNVQDKMTESESDNVLSDVEADVENEVGPLLAEEMFEQTYESDNIPSDIEASGDNEVACLPEKSREAYEQAYIKLEEWCNDKGIKNYYDEKILLVYFEYLSKQRKPSSLWVYYSMLRAVISLKKNVDISKYTNLNEFLKRQSEGFQPKKSEILKKEDISKFLLEMDDRDYLMMKVALIIGLAGACRREELTNLMLQNVKDEGEYIRIKIPKTKTKTSREFFVTSWNMEGINMVEMVRRYIAIRPNNTAHGRFFVAYKNGKCFKQPVGVNTFGKMPSTIASLLCLPNPQQYTGHCFRRSSASLLTDSDAGLLTVKRPGGRRRLHRKI